MWQALFLVISQQTRPAQRLQIGSMSTPLYQQCHYHPVPGAIVLVRLSLLTAPRLASSRNAQRRRRQSQPLQRAMPPINSVRATMYRKFVSTCRAARIAYAPVFASCQSISLTITLPCRSYVCGYRESSDWKDGLSLSLQVKKIGSQISWCRL